jgi:hypothetical protein
MPLGPAHDDHVLRFADQAVRVSEHEVRALRLWIARWEPRDATRSVVIGLYCGSSRALGDARLRATADELTALGVDRHRIRLGPDFLSAPEVQSAVRPNPRDAVWIRLADDPPQRPGP